MNKRTAKSSSRVEAAVAKRRRTRGAERAEADTGPVREADRSGSHLRRTGPSGSSISVRPGPGGQRPPGPGVGPGDLVRRPGGHHSPPAVAPLGPQVDDPVGRPDRRPGCARRPAACGRRRSAGRTTASSRSTSAKCSPVVGSSKRNSAAARAAPEQFGGEQQPLPLAPRERVGPLAETQIARGRGPRARPASAGVTAWRRVEEACRASRTVISSTSAIDAAVEPAGEHLRLEAAAAALVARHPDVGQEVHADPDPPGALARLAPAALHVRREVALRRGPRALASGVAAKRSRIASNTPRIVAGELEAARGERSRSAATTREKPGSRRQLDGRDSGRCRLAAERRGQHVEHQRRLAAARDAGEGDEAARRDVHVEAAQVVAPGVAHARCRDAGHAVRDAGAVPRRAPVRSARQRPVTDSAASASEAGGPAATMRPPSSPAPGPGRSRGRPRGSPLRRARRRRPCCRRPAGALSRPSSRAVSRGCRPAVGSSST